MQTCAGPCTCTFYFRFTYQTRAAKVTPPTHNTQTRQGTVKTIASDVMGELRRIAIVQTRNIQYIEIYKPNPDIVES